MLQESKNVQQLKKKIEKELLRNQQFFFVVFFILIKIHNFDLTIVMSITRNYLTYEFTKYYIGFIK